MTRRSFSSRLLKAALIVALAPRMAFKDVPALPVVDPQQKAFVEAFFFDKPIRPVVPRWDHLADITTYQFHIDI